MTSRYFDSTGDDSQYYFNSSSNTTSQRVQNYSSSATPSYGTPSYSSYPVNQSSSRSSNQQIRLNDSYPSSQSYQSTGGFSSKSSIQQQYPSSPLPAPQVRASVRVLGTQDSAYQLQNSPRHTHAVPQEHHFQFDSRQQPGRATGPAVVYQTPGAAQYTHHNVDLWTESPSYGSDQYVQAQRVSVRPVSTSSHSVSPQRHQDPVQQYYSQLTPEQHQQLLRQQQIQRQQEQNSSYEQQRRVTVQQVSPPSSSYQQQQQQQQRSTASFAGGHQSEQGRGRSEVERQRQDEQDYYSAQRQMTAQRMQQQDEEYHPVGIRNLMNKFAGPATIQPRPPRSRSTSSRHNSSSNYNSYSGPGQITTTRTSTTHSMTYSALPKSHEPPVNSVEYYQMQQLMGNPYTNIQQAAAPIHIQQAHSDLSSLRDQFKASSMSDGFSRPMMSRQAPPPQQQRPMQRQTSTDAGSSLSSLRHQYMNRTKEPSMDEAPTPPAYTIPRTILGEDIPRPKQQPQAPLQMQPAAQVLQKPSDSIPQQSAPAPQASEQQPQHQGDSGEPTTSPSETTAPPLNEGDLAVSSF